MQGINYENIDVQNLNSFLQRLASKVLKPFMNLISSVHSLKSVTALYPILCIKIETVVNLAMREFEKCLCSLTPLDIIPSSNLKRPNIPLSPDHLSIKMHVNLFDASVQAKLSLTKCFC